MSSPALHFWDWNQPILQHAVIEWIRPDEQRRAEKGDHFLHSRQELKQSLVASQNGSLDLGQRLLEGLLDPLAHPPDCGTGTDEGRGATDRQTAESVEDALLDVDGQVDPGRDHSGHHCGHK